MVYLAVSTDYHHHALMLCFVVLLMLMEFHHFLLVVLVMSIHGWRKLQTWATSCLLKLGLSAIDLTQDLTDTCRFLAAKRILDSNIMLLDRISTKCLSS